MNEQTYWNHTGTHQKDYEDLKSLVPDEGKAETPAGEILRCMTNLYYDWHNNGGGNFDNQRAQFDHLKNRAYEMGCDMHLNLLTEHYAMKLTNDDADAETHPRIIEAITFLWEQVADCVIVHVKKLHSQDISNELAAARARIARLEAALQVFADAANETDHLPENNITSRITHGDLREARSALQEK